MRDVFRVWILALCLLPAMGLPACQRAYYYDVLPLSSSTQSGPGSQVAYGTGNATGFEGQIARYIYVDPAHPCSLGGDGKALPNAEITVSTSASGQTAQLVRSGCADLSPPQTLNPSNLQFATDGSGGLTYQGDVFSPLPPVPAPTLSLDFTTTSNLPSALSWSRSSGATYFDGAGALATAPSNQARFDYDPVTHALRGLLMEPQATNLLSYSQDFSSGWKIDYATLSANGAPSPDGVSQADKITEDTTANAYHGIETPGLTLADSAVYTVSMYAKTASTRGVDLVARTKAGNFYNANFDLPAGTFVSGSNISIDYSIVPVGNGWYRVSHTFNSETGSTVPIIIIQLDMTSPYLGRYAGDGTSGVYLWGVQLEAGPVATSYIPTSGSSATRAADVAQFSSMGWYNPAAGTLYAEYVDIGGESSSPYPVFGLFGANDGTFSQNEISLSDQGGSNSSAVVSGGSVLFNPGGSLNGAGNVNKQALAYQTGGFSYSSNGAPPAMVSGTTAPPAAAYGYLGSQPDGKVRSRYLRKIQYYGARLDDATLQQLTR